jgi:hypothetical protein
VLLLDLYACFASPRLQLATLYKSTPLTKLSTKVDSFFKRYRLNAIGFPRIYDEPKTTLSSGWETLEAHQPQRRSSLMTGLACGWRHCGGPLLGARQGASACSCAGKFCQVSRQGVFDLTKIFPNAASCQVPMGLN